MIRTNPLLLLIAAAVLLNSTAYAQSLDMSETEIVNIKVKFGDLDLDKLADARVLFTRLKMAATHACGPVILSPYQYGPAAAAIIRDNRECIAGALADVVARLNAPLVSRVYAETRQIKSVDVASR